MADPAVSACGDAPHVTQEDQVQQAAAGLVHRHGPFVFATRAAVRFEELQT